MFFVVVVVVSFYLLEKGQPSWPMHGFRPTSSAVLIVKRTCLSRLLAIADNDRLMTSLDKDRLMGSSHKDRLMES